MFGQWRGAELPAYADAQSRAVKDGGGLEEEPLFCMNQQCAEMWRGTAYKEGWTGSTPNRDGLIMAAQRQVDLFEETLKLGRLPVWFRDQRRAYLNRINSRN